MNDQNDSDEFENPLNSETPRTYEEAYYTDSEARALYDTYLMLRKYGYDVDELVPLMLAIEKLTIYAGDNPEGLQLRLMIEDAEE